MFPNTAPGQGPGGRYPPIYRLEKQQYDPFLHTDGVRPQVAAAVPPVPPAMQNVGVQRILSPGEIVTSDRNMLVVDVTAFGAIYQNLGNVLNVLYRPNTFIVSPGLSVGLLINQHDVDIVHFTTCPPLSLRIDPIAVQRFDSSLHYVFVAKLNGSRTSLFTTPPRQGHVASDVPVGSAIVSHAPTEAYRHMYTNATAEAVALRAENSDLRQRISLLANTPTAVNRPSPASEPVAPDAGQGPVGERNYSQAVREPAGELADLNAAYSSFMTAMQQLSPRRVDPTPALASPPVQQPTRTLIDAQIAQVTPIIPPTSALEMPAHNTSAACARKEWKVLYSMEKFMHKPGNKSYTSHQFKNWLNVTLELGMKHFFCLSMHAPDTSLPAGWAEYLGHLIDPQFFKTHILPIAHTLTMSSFKELAMKAYAPSIRSESDIARQKIIAGTITQGYNSVAAYVSSFTDCMLLIQDMSEADRMAYFRRGLKSSIREQCIANFRVHPPREFTDLADLQQFAAWIELEQNERAHDQPAKHFASPRSHAHYRRSHATPSPVVAPVMGNAPRNSPSQHKRQYTSVSGGKGHTSRDASAHSKKTRLDSDQRYKELVRKFSEVSTQPYEYGRRNSVLFVCRHDKKCPKCLGDWHDNWARVNCQRAADPPDHFMPRFNELTAKLGLDKRNGAASGPAPMSVN